MDDTILYKALGVDVANYWFNCALQEGRKRRFKALFTRRNTELKDLEDYKSQSKGGHYAGRQEVDIDDIQGTEGRQKDFDAFFYPLTDRIRQRWQGVARAFDQGVNFPPVELIQVGKIFFVRDGHHRISLARSLGLKTIDAEVTV